MNEHLNQRLEAIRATLLAQSRASIPMPSATRGDEREVFLREFLSRVFPSHFRFGSGSVVDANGSQSGQVDIVVELPYFPSIPVPPSDTRLYLVEGVAAAIEVKSDLSAQWGQAEDTIAGVRSLKRSVGPGSVWIGQKPSEILPTFAVGYRGYKTVDSLVRRLDATPPSRRPDGVLVLEDPGLFIFGTTAAEGPDAMLLFLGVLINYCTQVISSRFDFRPYITWDGEPSSM